METKHTTLTLRGNQLQGNCSYCHDEEVDLVAVCKDGGFLCLQCAAENADSSAKPLYHVSGSPTAFGEVFIKRARTTSPCVQP